MVRNVIKKIVNFGRWLLCPPFCVHCKIVLVEDTILCFQCRNFIQPIVSTTLALTAKTSVRVFAISSYQDPIKSLILAKIQSQRLASRQLGELIWQLTPLSNLEFDYIVPIPLHWTRYAYRGYNQAEEIAHTLSKKSGKPVVSLLKRNRRTVFQSSLPTDLRNDNVASALSFHSKIERNNYSGKRFIIVDDLMTTGSTLRAATKLLMTLHPLTIDAVVAARTS